MPGEPLNALVLEAMMSALDKEKRDELIRKALEALITPPARSSYDRGPPKSPLQEAFDLAVYQTAKTIVEEMLVDDEIRDRVRGLVAVAFDKLLIDRDVLASKLASAITEAIRGH